MEALHSAPAAKNAVGAAGNLLLTKKGSADRRAHLRRPVPADFVARANGCTIERLCRHYRTGNRTVARWINETGAAVRAPGPAPDPAPADFADLCGTMHKAALARHYDVGQKVILRWLKDGGLQAQEAGLQGGAIGRPVPADFRRTAANMTRGELKSRYAVGGETLRRWIEESGANPIIVINRHITMSAPPVPPVGGSAVAQAAQHLRRCGWIVYACSVLEPVERLKLPNSGKGMWMVGGKGALDEAALVAFARAKGFDPTAWARI